MMKHLLLLGIFIMAGIMSQPLWAQSIDTLTIKTLSIEKKEKEAFSSRDSSLVLIIDTLIMKDRSHIEFYGKKEVTLKIKHAVFGKDAVISGTDGKNNGTDITIYANIHNMKRLLVDAGGRDAFNGTKTHPNGDGGNVNFYYLDDGLKPQLEDSKGAGYLAINVKAGGYRVNSQSEIGNILSRIGQGNRPLGTLPQGRVYSGSPGLDGKQVAEAVDSLN